MENIGPDISRLLVDRMFKHPVFGRVVYAPPEGVLSEIANSLSNESKPDENKVYYKLNDKTYLYSLYPVERECKNSLLIRAVVSSEGFRKYHPKDEKHIFEIPDELSEENIGRAKSIYRTKDVIHEARVHNESFSAISATNSEYFLVGKLRNSWKKKDITYWADMPIIAVPGLEEYKLIPLELKFMTCKKSSFHGLGYKGISFKEYVDKTGDYEYLIRLLKKQ